MRIAIPSYKRALIIKDLTIGYLVRCGIDLSLVDLFVSDEVEAGLYSTQFSGTIINTNAGNGRDKVNYIHTYYKPGS